MTPVIDARAAGDVAELLAATCRAEVMPRFRRLALGAVRQKSGPLDLVTDADEAAERVIADGLLARFPGCVVVGEEAVSAAPALLELLGDAALAFTIDPIDGTANYAAGLPLFGCMVAAVRRGEIVGAWIHDPLGQDTAIALRGEGAWIESAHGRTDLRVAAPAHVSRMVAVVSWSWLREPQRSLVAARLPRFAGVAGYRCAAHEWRAAAGGHLHALVYGRLMPWDHAPGWLLHREAGGYAARFDGSAYAPMTHDGGLIAAPDRGSWEAVRGALLGEGCAAGHWAGW